MATYQLNEDVAAARDLLNELQNALNEAHQAALDLSYYLERTGYQSSNAEMIRASSECELYLSRTLQSFADDDQDNMQMGSIGSLAHALDDILQNEAVED